MSYRHANNARYAPRTPRPGIPYIDPSIEQYIVEYRPGVRDERYLFTQKSLAARDLVGGATLRTDDPIPGDTLYGHVRPIVVGIINPKLETILYLSDQA